MRYRAKARTFYHRPDAYNPESREEEGVMLFAKGHAFFVADEHIYNVANLLIDTYEEKSARNG